MKRPNRHRPFLSWPRAAIVLATVLGLLAVGCAGTTESTEMPEALVDLIGVDYADANAVIAHSEQLSNKMAELIGACMRSRGFEYSEPQTSPRSPFPAVEAPGTQAWTQRYGLGVSTLTFAQWQMGAELVGYPSVFALATEDRTQQYLQSLGPAERDAYNLALNGEVPIDTSLSQEELERIVAESDSCRATAAREATTGDAFFEVFSTFGDEILAIGTALGDDPRVIEYERALAQCLGDRGFLWSNLAQERARIRQEIASIEPIDTGQILLDAGMGPTSSFEEMEQVVTARSHLTDDDAAVLLRVQREEVALALAAVECERTVGERHAVENAVRQELEAAFLARHSDSAILTDLRSGT